MATAVETTTAVPEANMTDVPIEIPQYTELIGYLQQMIADARKYVAIVRSMQRGHLGLLKKSIKKKRRNVNQNGDVPTGFNKPVKVSPMLADFLQMGHEDHTSRSEVTKKLTKYFKDHDLQNPENRREILFNKPGGERLATLFPNLKDGENLSFFNLQHHLKSHFITIDPATEPAAGSENAPVPPTPVANKNVRVVKRIARK